MRGFTLVEMIVVFATISLMVVVVFIAKKDAETDHKKIETQEGFLALARNIEIISKNHGDKTLITQNEFVLSGLIPDLFSPKAGTGEFFDPWGGLPMKIEFGENRYSLRVDHPDNQYCIAFVRAVEPMFDTIHVGSTATFDGLGAPLNGTPVKHQGNFVLNDLIQGCEDTLPRIILSSAI